MNATDAAQHAARLDRLAQRLYLSVALTTLIHTAWVKAQRPESGPLWEMLIHVSP